MCWAETKRRFVPKILRDVVSHGVSLVDKVSPGLCWDKMTTLGAGMLRALQKQTSFKGILSQMILYPLFMLGVFDGCV